jgi:hypothetical protein
LELGPPLSASSRLQCPGIHGFMMKVISAPARAAANDRSTLWSRYFTGESPGASAVA